LRRIAVSLILASALFVPPPARAQSPSATSPRDVAAAEILFQEAQKLFVDGDYAAACGKFAASYDLDPGLGTLLNLGRCYEKAGRTASAWAAYVDLSALASRAGQADRATIADERIAALEPELMRLALRVPADADIEVRLDGEPVARELFGSALPVDPGEHRVSARRPGQEPYDERTITASEPGKTVTITLPAPPVVPPPAEERPAPSTTAQPPTVRPEPTPVPEPPPPDGDDRTAWWIAGGITGGVGLVVLGVGAGFTAKAASAWSWGSRSPGGR